MRQPDRAITRLACGRSIHSLVWRGSGSAERVIIENVVPVTVSGNDGRLAAPGTRSRRVDGNAPERRNPVRSRRQCVLDQCRGALLDEMRPFVEGTPHVGIHLAHRPRDETGDEPVFAPPRAATRRLRENSLEAFVEHGCGILSILESARRSDTREQRVDVVPERFGASKAGSQCTERIRSDRGLGQCGWESTRADEVRPPRPLCGRRDRLVLGSELCDRSPALLLGDERLVCRQFGSHVAKHAHEDVAGRRIRTIAGMTR